MKPDRSEQEQVTFDEYNNWFPHPSPDGQWIVLLSYGEDVKGHPPDKDVLLRLMPIGGGDTRMLAKVFGGQGTINVPSWSPDSRQVAFVSYHKPPG
jgi:Tol biopolymer transport system component